MKNFSRFTFLVLIGLYFLISCAGNVQKHQDFNTIKTEITSIAIMPPSIEYFERNPVVIRPNPFYINDVSHNVVEAIQKSFANSTIEVHPIFDSGTELDVNVSSNLRKVLQSYKSSCESFHNNGEKDMRMVLDSEVKQFVSPAKTNFLLFIHGKGYGKLSGEDRNDVVYSGMLGTESQWDGLILDLALVDASSGEMLWFNYNKEYQSQYQPLVLESVQELCDKLLNNLSKLGALEGEDSTEVK